MRDDWRRAIDKRAATEREMKLHKLGITPTPKPRLSRTDLELRRLLRLHDS
jgi:hypothetical protein